MVPQPETHYVKGPGGNIAYQVFGGGPIDLVIVPGWLSHVDLLWQEPGWVTLMSELTSFARVIRYEKHRVVRSPNARSNARKPRRRNSDRAGCGGKSAAGDVGVLLGRPDKRDVRRHVSRTCPRTGPLRRLRKRIDGR